MPRKEVKTTTNDNWNVSFGSGTDLITGERIKGYRLSVFRFYDRGQSSKFRYGQHNGMIFATIEEASAFALAHGYLQVYYPRTWCLEHRKLHTFMGKPSPTFSKCLSVNGEDCP